MTREEAIKWIEALIDTMKEETCGRCPDPEYKDEVYEALDIAIKSLEQEPILDKIRAEIAQKQYDFMANTDYDEGVRFGLMLAYQILDKYKESEE